jgi:hypothetical protein
MTVVIPGPTIDDDTEPAHFTRAFKYYMLGFCLLSVAMLTVVSWNAGIIIRDTQSFIKKVRSAVIFSEYHIRGKEESEEEEEELEFPEPEDTE